MAARLDKAWPGLFLILVLFGTTIHAQPAPDPELRRLLIKAANDSSSFADRFDAEVWLTDMSGRLARQVPDTNERLQLLKQIHFEATKVDLYPELVLAVIDIESNFDRFAISSAGAIGLMQIMPFWLKEIGRPEDNLIVAQTNLRMGCTILKYYLDMENQDLIRGLARYNGSKGRRKYGDLVIDRLNRKWYRN
ncbi:MAG: lytic transglycosylase domain-containing protein [Gammaproteobacteria bacterium]|nr:lytic transglycosylase domain-containing protein [Gammaproteobacteria bacterium]